MTSGERQAGSVSVVVPTRGRGETILPTLSSVLSGVRRPDELLVSEQGEDPGTRRAVEAARSMEGGAAVRHVRSDTAGLSVNRNEALGASRGEFVVFVDDDVRVDGEWLQRIVGEWRDGWGGDAVVVTGRLLPGPEFGPDVPVPSIRTETERRVFRTARPFDVLYGAYFGAPHSTFDLLEDDPFDEGLGAGTPFPGGEDEDFAFRLLKRGVPIVYEPSIVAFHHPALRSWRRTRYDYAVGAGAYLAKHILAGEPSMVGSFVRVLAGQLRKGVSAGVRGREPEGSARLCAALGLLVGFGRWWLGGRAKSSSRT